ncbi:MAG: hypothetical protein IPJ77_09990 [Planctomycetes bacterium]|nr:hypothetical protein [Planctomycetota bacterium]
MKTIASNPVVRWMNVEELRSLIATHVPPCVSIYLPTHPGGSQEDKHHYEGLLRRARAELARHLSSHEADDAIAPLEHLFRPQDWKDELSGLAVFRSQEFEAVYRLPMKVEERVVVGDSFHVRPLLEYLQANQRYFLLVLSQGRVGFMKGSMHGLVPVDLRTLPRSLTSALGVEDHERNVRQHSSGAFGTMAMYSGRGKDDGSRDEDFARFFRMIDKELMLVLRDENVPLVVAAPDRQFAIYASVSRYPHLLAEGLHGSFAHERGDELHARAWPLVQKHVAERESIVLEHYSSGISHVRSTDEVTTIARAAVQGRVRELLLARGTTLGGRLDRETGTLELWKEKRGEMSDVLDDLAEAVLLRGGEVFSFDRHRMPSSSPIAATLRW